MAKWYGSIGYAETVETSPGIWKEMITDRKYYGDLIRNSARRNSSGTIMQGASTSNDDITISNSISIVCDPYAIQNFSKIKYAEFMGTLFRVTDISVEFPRLTLTLGGVYEDASNLRAPSCFGVNSWN